jgi:hypothetical protein
MKCYWSISWMVSKCESVVLRQVTKRKSLKGDGSKEVGKTEDAFSRSLRCRKQTERSSLKVA